MGSPLKGRPVIVTAITTASADDALAVLFPRAKRSVGELAALVLASTSDPLDIIIDPWRARLIGTVDEGLRTAMLGTLTFSGALSVSPDANGLVRHYSINSNTFGDVSAFFHDFNKRSLAQIIDHFVRDDAANFVIASQNNFDVQILIPGDAETTSDFIDGYAFSGFTLCYELQNQTYSTNTFE